MALSLYDIIKGPVISDKAYKLNKAQNKLMLNVHLDANKPMVKEALEKLFSVKVESVNIIIRDGKKRRVKGRTVQGGKQKRAIITLVEGYKLDLFDQAGAHAVAAEPTVKDDAADHSKRVR